MFLGGKKYDTLGDALKSRNRAKYHLLAPVHINLIRVLLSNCLYCCGCIQNAYIDPLSTCAYVELLLDST
jgi:hypothetical protein